MPDSSIQKLIEKVTDLSLFEKLKQSDTAHLLFNIGLYLSTILPLLTSIDLPILTKPWQSLPIVILLLFVVAGFGGVYKLAVIIRYFIHNLRLYIEFYLKLILSQIDISIINKKLKMRKEFENNSNFVSLSDVRCYLATHEDLKIQKEYDEKMQAIENWYVARENAMFSLLLILGQLVLNGILIQEISQYLPSFRLISWLIVISLIYWSTSSLPIDAYYLYLPNNNIRSLPLKTHRKAGSARGLFIMSDDFDEPLEDFQEYMK